MSVSRNRKDAAKALGIAIQVRYLKLQMANTEDEISIAAVDLGKCFNDNIRAIIWFIREYGGAEQAPLERVNAPLQKPMPVTPPIFLAGADVDMPRK